MTEQATPRLPPGALPIDVDEMFAAIGELYFQARVMRRMLAQQQQQAAASQADASRNGVPV